MRKRLFAGLAAALLIIGVGAYGDGSRPRDAKSRERGAGRAQAGNHAPAAAHEQPAAHRPAAIEVQSIAQLRSQLEWPTDPPKENTPYRTSPAPFVFRTFTSVQVNVDANGNNIVGDAANEPSIAVDPTNPNRIAIGWRQFDTIASNFRQAGYGYSRDDGRSWTFPGRIDPGVFRSDPVLAANANGDFHYMNIFVDPSFTIFRCDMFISSDGGMSWNGPFNAFGGDKEWFVIDTTGSAGHGNIYQAWNTAGNNFFPNQFDRSLDTGLTWQNPIELPQPRPVFGTLDLDPNGVLYIAGTRGGNNYVIKSTSAKNPLQSPTFSITQVNLDGSVAFGGVNPDGLLGQLWVVVDRSNAATRGNIYLLASVTRGVDILDVMFSRSEDGGQTWSAPVRVNDDVQGSDAWQWFGTMSVAPNGRIDVIWNDTRNDPVDPANPSFSELFYASSTDGGRNWSANQPVSPPFNHTLGYPQQNKLGDYYDMISDEVGAHVAYAATFNGEQDVYYMRIGEFDCNANGVADSLDLAGGGSTDINSNGILDECDCIGDADGDFDIDLSDLATVLAIFGACDPDPAYDPAADFNADGCIDLTDLAVVLALFGSTCP